MTIDKDAMAEVFDKWDSEKYVAILLQRNPDPDAMGSAAGFQLLLKNVWSLDSKIYYYGEISHPQNKSIKNVLHIPMQLGDKMDQEHVGAVVVLDTDFTNTDFLSETLKKADVRIDHHTMDRDEKPRVLDVRNTGSCAAIVWDYLREYKVSLEENAAVATALLMGIETDTLHFTSSNTSVLDYEAYRSLLPFISKEGLAKVTKFTIPKAQFEYEVTAFQNMKTTGSIVTTFIGDLNEHNRDIIPTIADRFARMEAVSTVIVMGIVKNHLIASIRSDDSRRDISELCERAFGKDYSGAKEGSGGARVPLGVGFGLLDGEIRENAILAAIEGFNGKILEALGEGVDTLSRIN